MQEFRFGLRVLRKNRTFAATAILTLAIGITACTAMFSIVNAVLFSSLPYEKPEEICIVWANVRGEQTWLSPAEIQDLKLSQNAFSGIVPFTDVTINLTGGGEAEELQGAGISSSAFEVLGIQPVIGRTIQVEEDQNRSQVVVLSYEFWQKRFNSDPEILGRTLILDGLPYAIIGILPSKFKILPPSSVFPSDVDVWIPLNTALPQAFHTRRDIRMIHTLARLKKGVSENRASEELKVLSSELVKRYPQNYPAAHGFHFTVASFQKHLTAGVRKSLWFLMASVVFVILISCLNVAGLLIAKGESRRQEMAIRQALGAGRSTLMRQLLSESLILAAIAGALGLALAFWANRYFQLHLPEKFPAIGDVAIDFQVFGFALLVVIAATLICALIPGFRVTRINIQDVLKTTSSNVFANSRILQKSLIIVEIALAFVLLTGTGLTLRSFENLQKIHPGFRPEGVMTFKVRLPESKYDDASQRAAFVTELTNGIKEINGVWNAGAITQIPLSGAFLSSRFRMERGNDQEPFEPDLRGVTNGYFSTMGIRTLAGRTFDTSDWIDSKRVAIIDKTLANKFWPGRNSVGNHLYWIRGEYSVEVIGVVEDIKHYSLDQPSRPTVYFPYSQYSWIRSLYITVQSTRNPEAIASDLQAVVRNYDPDLPLAKIRFDAELCESIHVQTTICFVRTSLIWMDSTGSCRSWSLCNDAGHGRIKSKGIRYTCCDSAHRLEAFFGWSWDVDCF